MTTYIPAPDWHIGLWFNTDEPLVLPTLRGRVIAMHTFQMLCPGCVSHGLPQTKRIQQIFGKTDLVVFGLHTVFEHHNAMQPHALEAFLYEYRITFPVGVDEAAADTAHPIPKTMQAYELQGTPSLVLIDRQGRLRRRYFGATEDMAVGAEIAMLLSEDA